MNEYDTGNIVRAEPVVEGLVLDFRGLPDIRTVEIITDAGTVEMSVDEFLDRAISGKNPCHEIELRGGR